MHHLEVILTELIDYVCVHNHDEYLKVEHELYKLVYGEHLNDTLAYKWVSKMENKDGTKGAHWTIDQTNQYAGNYDKYDWYAVLNMMYSDYYNPKFDTNTYIELAKDWLDDTAVGEGKTLKYYLYVVCEK